MHEVETAQGPLTVTFCRPCPCSKPINKNKPFRARAVIASWPASSADPYVHDMDTVWGPEQILTHSEMMDQTYDGVQSMRHLQWRRIHFVTKKKHDDGNHSEGKSVICFCWFRIVVILCTAYERDLDAGCGTSGCSLTQLSRMVNSASYGVKTER